MQYLKVSQIAKELDRSPNTIHKWVAKRKLPGRKLGGTWITTDRELRDFKKGIELDKIDLSMLFDVKSIAEYFGVEITVIRRMIDDGKLKGTPIDNRGGRAGTLVFNLRQTRKAHQHLDEYRDARPGRPVKGNPDDHIIISETAGITWYHIQGTSNDVCLPYAYKHLHQARSRAREAFETPPIHQQGDVVEIYLPNWPEGDRCHRAIVLKDVTPICAQALVKLTKDAHYVDGSERFEGNSLWVDAKNGIVATIRKVEE